MTDAAPLFAVLLKSEDDMQLGPISQALAAFKRIPLQDASHEAKMCWGIIGENLIETEARRLVDDLAKFKIGARVVPMASLPQFSAVSELTHVVCGMEGLTATASSGPSISLPWKSMNVIAAASFKSSTSKTVEEKQGPTAAQKALSVAITLATMIPVSIGPKKKTIQKTISNSEVSFLLDIVTDAPLAHYRIDSNQFDYTVLKERMLYNVMGNFKLILDDIASKSPTAQRNRGTRVFLANQPITAMGYESLKDLERECRWLTALGRLSLP